MRGFSRMVVSIMAFCTYFSQCSEADTDRSDAFITYSEKQVIGCRDKDASCESWASAGECQKNSQFMETTCPVACGACTAAELNVTAFLDEVLVFETPFGEIHIKPDFINAPRTCALILDLAHQQDAAKASTFYRAELAPNKGDGPPYGLLQGNLVGLLKSPPHEGIVEVKYGDVAMIQGADFYIAAMDHPGWGSSHTVWGHVHDMRPVARILAQPYEEFKHPVGTVMRMLVDKVPFTPRAQKRRA